MDNALFVGLSRQMILRREMEIIANVPTTTMVVITPVLV